MENLMSHKIIYKEHVSGEENCDPFSGIKAGHSIPQKETGLACRVIRLIYASVEDAEKKAGNARWN